MASDKTTDEANDPIVPLHVGYYSRDLINHNYNSDPDAGPIGDLGRQDLQLILRPSFNTPKKQHKRFIYKDVTSFTVLFKYRMPFNFDHYQPRAISRSNNKGLRIFVMIVVNPAKTIFCHRATYPSNIFIYHNDDIQDYNSNIFTIQYLTWRHSIKSVPKKTRLDSLTYRDLFDEPLIKPAILNGFKIVYTNDDDGHEVSVLDPQTLRDSELKEKGGQL
jgi:hypothetical protein